MAPTLWQQKDREAILNRFAKLTPDRTPQWGQMDAVRMVVHVTDGVRMAMGEIECAPKKGPFKLPVIKQLIMFYLPWPKGAPTAPELLARVPKQWTNEIELFRDAMDRFGMKNVDGAWPMHPAFGSVNGREWGRLMYRHLDHHLTQFNV